MAHLILPTASLALLVGALLVFRRHRHTRVAHGVFLCLALLSLALLT